MFNKEEKAGKCYLKNFKTWCLIMFNKNEIINIKILEKSQYVEFKAMFCDYFINDLAKNLDKNFICERILGSQVLKLYEQGVIYIDILYINDQAKGFIIYQIDSSNSDWCERVGHGFIREFYIDRDSRKKGLGSLLLKHIENTLLKLGIENIYLTSNSSDYVKKFYIRNGYMCENAINKFNKNEYFSKKL